MKMHRHKMKRRVCDSSEQMMSTTAADDNTATERVEEHLNRALDADSSATKNYHIRTALQLLDVSGSIDDRGPTSE